MTQIICIFTTLSPGTFKNLSQIFTQVTNIMWNAFWNNTTSLHNWYNHIKFTLTNMTLSFVNNMIYQLWNQGHDIWNEYKIMIVYTIIHEFDFVHEIKYHNFDNILCYCTHLTRMGFMFCYLEFTTLRGNIISPVLVFKLTIKMIKHYNTSNPV